MSEEDQLTEEQKQIMEQSIINKGLLPLYNALTGPSKQKAHNKAMISCAALMMGALSVINEDNKAEVTKFLDRAYTYNKWYLDNLQKNKVVPFPHTIHKN